MNININEKHIILQPSNDGDYSDLFFIKKNLKPLSDTKDELNIKIMFDNNDSMDTCYIYIPKKTLLYFLTNAKLEF